MNLYLIGGIAIMLMIMGLFLGTLKIVKRLEANTVKRRAPFTANLLRTPGYSLMEKLDNIQTELSTCFFGMMIIPIIFYATYIITAFTQRELSFIMGLISILLSAIGVSYSIYKIIVLMKIRRKFVLGFLGEASTAEELIPLMRNGYHVLHDFPADNFNIDHILVGKGGVFAVETKARFKPDRGRGKNDALVVVKENSLCFPDWCETKPIEQAKRQAQWLSQWLEKATGSPVHVHPVLTSRMVCRTP